VGFTATRLHAGEYFIYQDAKGWLVISNKKPPAGSKIIKQQNMPDLADSETPQLEERNETSSNGDAKTPKPTQNR
jgi:hypothetical protein